jgi:site-specific DNA-methyltransferase (adenine-specific)
MTDIELIHGDSLQALKGYGDNHFDVAIVDPPYGVEIEKNQKAYHENKTVSNGGKWKKYDIKGWDNAIPTKEYFNELQRVSKNQIIWGGNYFLDYLGNTKCFLIWDKIQRTYLADGEIAWTSLNKPTKVFRLSKIDAYVNELKKTQDTKIHPTQKPVSLYLWILENYTNENDLILDTHLGSGSIAIACHHMKRKLIGYEIDAEYYEKACKRFKEETAQQALW